MSAGVECASQILVCKCIIYGEYGAVTGERTSAYLRALKAVIKCDVPCTVGVGTKI